MKRGIGFAAAWVGATLLAVTVAAAAVGSVRSQVTDAPTQLGSPQAAALVADSGITSTQPPQDTNSTIPVDPGTLDVSPTTSTTTTGSSREGTTTTAPPVATTTTTPPVTTTMPSTTTTVPSAYTKSYDTAGGEVVIRVEGSSVTFVGAFPKTGWRVDLENGGPEKVELHFERNEEDGEVEFRASVEHGDLDVEISSGDDH